MTDVGCRVWEVGADQPVTIWLPRKLTPGNVARLRRYVDVLETEVGIATDGRDVPKEAAGGG